MKTVKKVRNSYARLTGVTYSAYEQMRASRGNDCYRMTYHDGVLWIMSPQYRREKGSRRLEVLVTVYTSVVNLDCEASGSTTFKKGTPGSREGNGKEGDETYYLGAVAAKIRHKDDLVLGVDPPPSLWIEVDNYGDAQGKLPLYAALGVPEVWQYRVRRRTLRFWRLAAQGYRKIDTSLALPGLTPEMVLELLEEADKLGRMRWDRWLRDDWFPKNRALFPDFTSGQPSGT